MHYNAKGKNEFKCQEKVQSNWHWEDHTSKSFSTAPANEEIKKPQTSHESGW